MRPQPFVPRGNQGGGSPSGGNNMEAQLAELQDTLVRLVAASAQPTPGATDSGASTSGGAPRLPHDPFEYGAASQVIGAVATRSQTGAPQVSTVAVDPLGRVTQGARHKGPVDGIGQSRLPMTFGLADVAANLPQGTPGGNDTEEGVVKSLALKVLQVPLFSGAQLQYPEFDPVAVYLMAGKIMQGKAAIPAYASTEAMQAKKGDSSSLAVDEDGTRVQAAKVAEETLRQWKGWKKDSSTSQALYHDSAAFSSEHPLCSTSGSDVATVYLAGVPARSARERHQVKPGVVRLVNEGQTFSMTRGDTSRTYPKRVLLDT